MSTSYLGDELLRSLQDAHLATAEQRARLRMRLQARLVRAVDEPAAVRSGGALFARGIDTRGFNAALTFDPRPHGAGAGKPAAPAATSANLVFLAHATLINGLALTVYPALLRALAKAGAGPEDLRAALLPFLLHAALEGSDRAVPEARDALAGLPGQEAVLAQLDRLAHLNDPFTQGDEQEIFQQCLGFALERSLLAPYALYVLASCTRRSSVLTYCMAQLDSYPIVAAEIAACVLLARQRQWQDPADYAAATRKYPLLDVFRDAWRLCLSPNRGGVDLVGDRPRTLRLRTDFLAGAVPKYTYALERLRTARDNDPAWTDGEPPRISFITSVFKGDEWLQHFMQDITAVDGFSACELILIDPGSPHDEFSVIEPYLAAHTNIFYIRLDFDPGLYNVWNLGVALARADLVSNANLDDRKSTAFIREHLAAFDRDPRLSLVSAPCYMSTVKNEDHAQHEARVASEDRFAFYTSAAEYGSEAMLLQYMTDGEGGVRQVPRNVPHCMPVWRRSLHERHGGFDERKGGVAADYEFWLRCLAGDEVFFNINRPLGVYYFSSTQTYSARGAQRVDRIARHYANQAAKRPPRSGTQG